MQVLPDVVVDHQRSNSLSLSGACQSFENEIVRRQTSRGYLMCQKVQAAGLPRAFGGVSALAPAVKPLTGIHRKIRLLLLKKGCSVIDQTADHCYSKCPQNVPLTTIIAFQRKPKYRRGHKLHLSVHSSGKWV